MRNNAIIAWVRINGLVIIAIAAAALIGHVSGAQRLYNWNASQSGMGLNTALEFLCTGVSLFLLAILSDEDK